MSESDPAGVRRQSSSPDVGAPLNLTLKLHGRVASPLGVASSSPPSPPELMRSPQRPHQLDDDGACSRNITQRDGAALPMSTHADEVPRRTCDISQVAAMMVASGHIAAVTSD